jgi:hypothetical protein
MSEEILRIVFLRFGSTRELFFRRHGQPSGTSTTRSQRHPKLGWIRSGDKCDETWGASDQACLGGDLLTPSLVVMKRIYVMNGGKAMQGC